MVHKGMWVILAENPKCGEHYGAFKQTNISMLQQDFIEAGNADIRCFVIGDQVVATMQLNRAKW